MKASPVPDRSLSAYHLCDYIYSHIRKSYPALNIYISNYLGSKWSGSGQPSIMVECSIQIEVLDDSVIVKVNDMDVSTHHACNPEFLNNIITDVRQRINDGAIPSL